MSDVAPAAPEAGPLSVDNAVAALAAKREAPSPAVEAPKAAESAPEPTESEAEPTVEGDAPEPEAANEDVEVEAQPEPEAPAIEPPKFWDADAKTKFRELSPEHQAIVLAQSEKGVQASAKAIQEASERAKQAEHQAAGITALARELADFLPQAISTFKSRWDGVDWVTLARDDPSSYVAYKAQHDAENGELERVKTANRIAQNEARAAFLRSESVALATHAPELVDPVKGPERQQALASYLKTNGASDEDVAGLTAVAAGIAYKAMLYDRAKAKPLTPAPKPVAQPVKVVPPTAAPAASSPRREVETLTRRLAQTGRPEDAIALLQARRKG
jgi:hypothetical protein